MPAGLCSLMVPGSHPRSGISSRGAAAASRDANSSCTPDKFDWFIWQFFCIHLCSSSVTYSNEFRYTGDWPNSMPRGPVQLGDKSLCFQLGSCTSSDDHCVGLGAVLSSCMVRCLTQERSLQKAQEGQCPHIKVMCLVVTQDSKNSSDLTCCSCWDANPVLHPVEAPGLAYLEDVYYFGNNNSSLLN